MSINNGVPKRKTDTILRCAEWMGFLLLAVLVLSMARHISMDLCPDEGMRFRLIEWICEHGALPTGYEKELLVSTWGFSYASEPLLPAIVSALLMKLCLLLGGSSRAAFYAARLTSVFSFLGCYVLCLRIGRRVFEKRISPLLFAVLICFDPQVLFFGCFMNCDMPALFGCLLTLDALLNCREQQWSGRSCVRLAVSLSVILHTYFNAYGWIPAAVIWCLFFCAKEGKGAAFVRKRFALVTGVVLLLTGWFYIRNMVLYEGDPTGLSYRRIGREYVETWGVTTHQASPYSERGSLVDMLIRGEWNWTDSTVYSMFGILGYMDIVINVNLIKTFVLITAAGALLGLVSFIVRIRQKQASAVSLICLLLTMVIPVVLLIYYSYRMDYQPQGRYLFSAFPALMFLMVTGYERGMAFLASRTIPKYASAAVDIFLICLILLWITLSLSAYFNTVIPVLMGFS